VERDVNSVRLVLRIGGSVVASPINAGLINEYVDLLKALHRNGHALAAVVGGGVLAREFISAAKDMGLAEEAQDEVAISVSRLFAQVFLAKLGKSGCATVPVTIEQAMEHLQRGKVVVMGGLRPGMTTDAVAAMVAERMKAGLYVKGTDQEGVYDKDPRKCADAVKLDHMTFKDLSRVLAESKHKAGIHQVLDPEAVKLLERGKVKVVVVNGSRPENVLLAVEGKKVGTLIE